MGSLQSFQSHLKLKINNQGMINTQNYLHSLIKGTFKASALFLLTLAMIFEILI